MLDPKFFTETIEKAKNMLYDNDNEWMNAAELMGFNEPVKLNDFIEELQQNGNIELKNEDGNIFIRFSDNHYLDYQRNNQSKFF